MFAPCCAESESIRVFFSNGNGVETVIRLKIKGIKRFLG